MAIYLLGWPVKDLLICFSCRALAAAVAVVPAAAARAEDASGVASSRMSYSRFLEYLDMGRVKKVQLLVRFPACTSLVSWVRFYRIS